MNKVINLKIEPDKESGLTYDLHLHSQFSQDSLVDIRKLPKIVRKKGLNGIAITDHKSLNGYRYLKNKIDDFLIIPGMEIETELGEIIGLFITEEINPNLTDFVDVMDDIKDKDGIAVIPHPFDRYRSNHLKVDIMNHDYIRQNINAVEILNSRIINKKFIYEAMQFCQFFNLAETGGSDAHTNWEVGNGYTFIEKKDPEEILDLASLKSRILSKKSKSCGKQSNPLVHAVTVARKMRMKFLGK